ncbi:AAA family ATPase [Breoghania sp. L-A4]|uniref:AAA family ATPase n=1 Tax=Breoghania sp. L-A4 TaxID=2304600 RepID=UPI000E3604C5|nr:AAA family ATPase [Breoghania sp. L-A4]AXS39707.1 hypothetical protein D1F64_06150 [Breoghania sp. L-A4]
MTEDTWARGRERINRTIAAATSPRFGNYPGLLAVHEFQETEIPPRRWCVPEWVPDRTVTALYADGGTGKSLLAMQLATAAATGTSWLGIEVPQRTVLFVSCEDERDELLRRQDAINRVHGLDFEDFGGRYHWLDKTTGETLLMTFKNGIGQPTSFGKNLIDLAKEIGAQLIVIDTAADTFGGREIERLEVRQFLTYLRRIATEIDGAVVVLAHPSVAGMKDRGYSGSTAWRASVRSLITFEFPEVEDDAPGPADLRILTRRKSNYAKIGTTITARYVGGAFVAETKEVDGSLMDSLQDEITFMNGLRKLLEAGICPSVNRTRPEYAPRQMKRYGGKEASQLPIDRLERAMRRLFDKGEIHVVEHRKGSKPVVPIDYDLSTWRTAK